MVSRSIAGIMWAALLLVSAATAVAADEGPILHWSFDGESGKVVKDLSGNGFDGKIIGPEGSVLRVRFSTRPGGRYRLTRIGSNLAEPDTAFQPARRARQERNWFGVKAHARF